MRVNTLSAAALSVALLASPSWAQSSRAPEIDHDDVRVQLPRMGRVSMIGVRLSDVTADNAAAHKLAKVEGAIVESVNPNSPAAAAGLRERDVVTHFDGERVRSAAHLTRLVQETPPGREVALQVMRDGRKTDLRIKPEAGSWFDPRFGEMLETVKEGAGEILAPTRSRSRLGINVQEVGGQLGEYFGVESGVLVTSVRAGTPAEKAGIKAGDVITAVDGRAIATPGDLVGALPEGDAKDVVLTVVREKKEMTLRAVV